ncbi:hypothetical protein GLOIN_2v1793319 [Rhizophagus irregularis DAOM 181602=DAOM 197198]|uniref:Uncharacterized protein n=2 Tax=Rhizophagus irregularis TaxID=588596 RepID=A0A2P4Q2H4_RHIID|nr:hypothetical protein GLOIN_2v1793319 [Rhizophagus irregularis DAOM 181602=DAOM 197198]POG71851.1 hypothetical protein GLOIN_2v1793319 [Rhizophagus irregularis DAOM 181602=DAOM 197198]|eukprot:XP_025178717.1 hypothetical protein GLOIN_2v1793319 [Rhizophagus irregularis DAOM 181602=DAOM 197198]
MTENKQLIKKSKSMERFLLGFFGRDREGKIIFVTKKETIMDLVNDFKKKCTMEERPKEPDATYAKKTITSQMNAISTIEIVHTKIETTGMTTKMKRIAIGKADTTMKEILDTTCNDNILAPTMTIDTTPTPKEETIHTQEEDLTTTIIEKMAEMRLEENDKVLTTNNRDITETMTTIATVTMPIDTTSTEKITTMDITEEGMKETTETMTGVEWLDAINWIPQTYNTIREGEEEEEGEVSETSRETTIKTNNKKYINKKKEKKEINEKSITTTHKYKKIKN